MLGPLVLGLPLAMYISCCLCQFCLRWVANANAFFSGIWAIKNCWSASWAMCMMRLGQGDPVHLLYYHSPSRFKVHDVHTDV